MRFLGFIFLSLSFGAIIVALDYFLPGNYLENFLTSYLVETFAIFIGLNTAAIIFLLGQLTEIEFKAGKMSLFSETKIELKHNIYLLIFSFCLALILLIFRPASNELDTNFLTIYFFINTTLLVSLFLLAIFALFEILVAVFSINPTINKK